MGSISDSTQIHGRHPGGKGNGDRSGDFILATG